MGENFYILLLMAMPVAAFLYSSVGHGGASSYIVLLTLFGFLPVEVRPAALVLNIFVSGIAFVSFRKTCEFPTSLFISLIVFSVPAAFLGGTFILDARIYQKLLGILLLFPILRLFNVFKVNNEKPVERKFWIIAVLGISIGFVSGLVGIGGGILLSPALILLGWASLRQTAAISALFIFLNSVSGLIGSGMAGFTWISHFEWILPLTLAGGIAGSYYGSKKYSGTTMKYALAAVLCIASFKFLIQ